MLRFILILIALYILWRVFKSIKHLLANKKPDIKKNRFDHIEDADYEDITDKKDE